MIKIKRGLDLPLAGAPKQSIHDAARVSTVAVLGPDYVGMKPTMAVKVGDQVKMGQELFSDKKNPGVKYTAPAAGEVVAVNRGERRVLQSVVIKIAAKEEKVQFAKFAQNQLSGLSREQVQENLVESGLWTALRTRPFSKAPAVGSVPNSIFVTAIDTHPLAADPAVVLKGKDAEFQAGLTLLSRLTDGKVFVCKAAGAAIPAQSSGSVVVEEFEGVHPAGLAGTHIHFLDPVSSSKTVWSIGYQDVVAIGQLFTTGELNAERVIAIGGPEAKSPRLLKTRLGANLEEISKGEVSNRDQVRLISGSVFGGRTANGALSFLGRFHNQLSILLEGTQRDFIGWLSPGANKHSVLNIYLSKLLGLKDFAPSTNTNGSERAMVPVGSYERVMPLDILPTHLLRSLIVSDIETAMTLGCLELDEEDLALCTYACPGKYEYGPILRNNLTMIEKEG
ncbi:Na+-transporting NADH:ubiquinone oxidoreductase subunit A [Oceanospirillum multiglobuliferum]|uniref:Na(+)-translocating NADH-quinone reductase subunit A n=1 Tax=Oceanospirillum multiglobuliferum TaxID=64969 RepID=A0A1T4N9S3_9GAMM|nr:Na(+)-translocating NADH-quinone reductase subunit A [Oceanospirillum multiglobuliferum]OPX55889.1 NADH:ubiquinone reductase (Na(+)-transporting) subunit A [Oceanospirillum multiglobuliferum]SJZ75971.1 Na+-transporting NADH:ubiquinone oxidoreductase subunit A [Oceanospirillum multiglobuliferum]